ncbi:MAG: HAD family hydrolase [archaeon]
MTIRVVSFDLDGTLVNSKFVNLVWMEGVPMLYAQRHGVDFHTAKEKIIGEYMKMGSDRLEWYNLQYWLDRFDLKISKEDILAGYVDQIELYPEVKETLSSLSESYDLVITSNAAREFIEAEVKNLPGCFREIFSATSDFGDVKKSAAVYREVCRRINLPPTEIIHVGDHYAYDYESPIQAGLKALFLDRKGNRTGNEVVRDLTEARIKIQEQP